MKMAFVIAPIALLFLGASASANTQESANSGSVCTGEGPVFGCPCEQEGATQITADKTKILACLNAGAAGKIWQNLGQTTLTSSEAAHSYVAQGITTCEDGYTPAAIGAMGYAVHGYRTEHTQPWSLAVGTAYCIDSRCAYRGSSDSSTYPGACGLANSNYQVSQTMKPDGIGLFAGHNITKLPCVVCVKSRQ